MDTLKLEKKWELIPIPTKGEFSTLLIDSTCNPDLNIGLSSSKNRCLILSLPLNLNLNFFGQEKENINIIYRKDSKENAIIIELTNHYLYSYFNDTIISLFYKIKDIKDVKDSSEAFIIAVNEWCSFFANVKNDKLDLNTIQGIFGELSVLNELVYKADSTSINYVLNSWRGLYDDNNDFYFDEKNIEIKTKRNSKTIISISSEFQLESENNKKIELLVVSIESVMVNGLTIESIVEKIKNKALLLNGDVSILYKALKQKNLTFLTFKDYNEYQFNLVSHVSYDANKNEFPKLISSEINSSLSKITYNINLERLNDFILYNQSQFNL